jgi:hypothetical protein
MAGIKILGFRLITLGFFLCQNVTQNLPKESA